MSQTQSRKWGTRIAAMLAAWMLGAGCASATRAPSSVRAIVPISPRFVGRWHPKDTGNLHPFMRSDIEIVADPEVNGLLRIKSGRPLNQFHDETLVDREGVAYRVTSNSETFQGQRKVVIGSIWQKIDDQVAEGSVRALSVILWTYELTTDDELIFEKYGYAADEPEGKFAIVPYSREFPKNYHTVYSRVR